MKYLLDSNVLIDIMRNRQNVIEKFRTVSVKDCFMADVSLWELYQGAFKSPRVEYHISKIESLIKYFTIIPLKDYVKEACAQKIRLQKLGKPIEDLDIMIGSASIANDCILVTNNEKHLSRLENVRIENWV